MTKAKRLQPTVAVLRELYLKSGNQCAYPGCLRPIVNSSGNYVGQICHIEAAEPGGRGLTRIKVMKNEELSQICCYFVTIIILRQMTFRNFLSMYYRE